jgi:hypothetical protein
MKAGRQEGRKAERGGFALRIAVLAVYLGIASTAFAQFGHPLKGTWSGDWGPNKDTRTRVLLELHWDGKAVTGTLNPGPNAAPLKVATLDPATWAVHFEADGKDRSGQPVRTVVDGKLENIGAYQRFMTGTWTEGSAKGDFKLTRN